jgi:ankyrin repeat protein
MSGYPQKINLSHEKLVKFINSFHEQEMSNYKEIHNFSGCYTLDELKQYLSSLITAVDAKKHEFLDKENYTVFFWLHSYNYAIALGYDVIAKNWSIIDENQLSNGILDFNISKPENIEKMAETILKIFDDVYDVFLPANKGLLNNNKPNGSNKLVGFSTRIFCDKASKAFNNSDVNFLDNSLREDMSWQEIHDYNSTTNQLRMSLIGSYWLYIAAQNGYADIVKLLLQNNKVNVNAVTKLGKTSLYIAIENGHKEIIKMILANEKTDVYAKHTSTTGFEIAYNSANNSDDAHVVKEPLKTEKANTNNYVDLGEMVLYMAVLNGHVDVVKEFLKNKNKDINAVIKHGKTPLYIAIENGHIEVVKEILNSIDVIKEQEYTSLLDVANTKAKENDNKKADYEYIINLLGFKLSKGQNKQDIKTNGTKKPLDLGKVANIISSFKPKSKDQK